MHVSRRAAAEENTYATILDVWLQSGAFLISIDRLDYSSSSKGAQTTVPVIPSVLKILANKGRQVPTSRVPCLLHICSTTCRKNSTYICRANKKIIVSGVFLHVHAVSFKIFQIEIRYPNGTSLQSCGPQLQEINVELTNKLSNLHENIKK